MLHVDFRARKGSFLLQPAFEAGDELVVLIGASGSGKSLTLKAIAGLLTPDDGEIVLPDGDIAFRSSDGTNIAPQRRNLGYVVQDLALFPHLSVRDNIRFSLHGRPRESIERRTDELISLLGLEGTEDRRPGAISGGQQQRVALARALAREPRLLLLDEPFSALDQALRMTMRRELVALQRRLGLTALFVTHDIDEAYMLGDRIVVYDDGRVVQAGSREEVFYRPATLQAATLVGVRNFIPGVVAAVRNGEADVETAWFRAQVAAPSVRQGDRVLICIRPEHVLVLRTADGSHDPRDIVLKAGVMEDTAHPQRHSLVMRVEGAVAKPPLALEVDVPTHPYELLGLAVASDRSIVLPFDRLFLVSAE